MGKRTILVHSPAQLSTSIQRLVVTTTDQARSYVPLSDIQSIVIDNREISLSKSLISCLGESNIAVYVCNDKHLPCSIVLPFNTHFHTAKRLQQQIALNYYNRGSIWKKIVQAKIINQSLCLKFLGFDNKAELLRHFVARVTNHDSVNTESGAASEYFKYLLGTNVSRRNDTVVNSCLNYGYALIRGLIARSVVGSGLNPALGIHHNNQFNQFNLVDDLIEPFRPLVDLFVYKQLRTAPKFGSEEKKLLLTLFSQKLAVSNRRFVIEDAVSCFTNRLVECYEQNSSRLVDIPVLIYNDT